MTIAVFSLSGAPGVTTLSLALASVWPTPAPVTVVEADASGGDVAAWWRLPTWPGLLDVAASSRPGQDYETPAITKFLQVLPGGLRVCVAPVTTDRTEGALELLAQNPKGLKGEEGVTLVDLGRVDPNASASTSLLEASEAAVLVSTSDVAQLKRVKETLPDLLPHSPRLGLAVVGATRSPAEMTEAIGLPVWAKVPRDARTAVFLSGQGQVRRLDRRPLIKAARSLGHTIEEQTQREGVQVPEEVP